METKKILQNMSVVLDKLSVVAKNNIQEITQSPIPKKKKLKLMII